MLDALPAAGAAVSIAGTRLRRLFGFWTDLLDERCERRYLPWLAAQVQAGQCRQHRRWVIAFQRSGLGVDQAFANEAFVDKDRAPIA